jgi:hypothetical protein
MTDSWTPMPKKSVQNTKSWDDEDVYHETPKPQEILPKTKIVKKKHCPQKNQEMVVEDKKQIQLKVEKSEQDLIADLFGIST